MFEHRIDDRQQLAHAGDECDLLGLPRRTQTLIEGPDDRIKKGFHLAGFMTVITAHLI